MTLKFPMLPPSKADPDNVVLFPRVPANLDEQIAPKPVLEGDQDPLKALERARYIVASLQSHLWQDDQTLPDEDAKGFLDIMTRWAFGCVEREYEIQTVARFCDKYGQSLDWLLLGDPVCMIVQGAANASRGRAVHV